MDQFRTDVIKEDAEGKKQKVATIGQAGGYGGEKDTPKNKENK